MIIKSGKNMRGRYFMLLSCVLIANALLIYDVFDWLKNTTDAILAVLLVHIFVYFLLVSSIYQHESAIGVHMSPPS